MVRDGIGWDVLVAEIVAGKLRKKNLHFDTPTTIAGSWKQDHPSTVVL